jgi:ABC-2 type transport system permease protein
MTAQLRLFWIGGIISYRALFNWIHPAMYIPTMLGSPLFQILFFAYLGRTAGVRDDAFFAIGNAVQVSAMAGIYGMTMAIANERQFGTLSALLATPANRPALFLGRAVPVIANGLLVSAFGFAVATIALDVGIQASEVLPIAIVTVICCASCTALGMLLGSFGLRARDVFFSANLVYFFMLLVCGVNVPHSDMPGWLAFIGDLMPMTHGIEAARELAAGASFASVSDLVLREVVTGLAYTALAYTLFRVFEREGRRHGSLDTF